jgi:antiviral helicase SLH1
MKALASEIVRKFSKRLAWLSIKVRELTGDMQMTKAEIAETQMIVTTPEKWDVVTRKPTGEGEITAVSIILARFFSNNNYPRKCASSSSTKFIFLMMIAGR